MDLNTILTLTSARSRDDLAGLGPTVVPLAGGSDLFGEPQTHLTGLVDLQTLGWEPLTVAADGLDIAATCTIAELSRLPEAIGLAAHPLFFQCAAALYGSFKIWNVATVGGNLCASLPAGPMTALAAALHGEVLLWRGDGSDERLPAVEFVTGNQANRLEPGDVLRSIFLPAAMLRSRTAFRRVAISPLGRSGTLLIGRADADGSFVLTITAGTLHPVQLRYDSVPRASALGRDIAAIDAWFTDAHGAADWRRAVSGVLGEEIRAELEHGPADPAASREHAREEVRA